MSDTTDYKQIAFKLQDDIDFKIWENAQRNIPFLLEMKNHAKKAWESKDVASYEMLLKMIDDWVDELKGGEK